MPIFASKVVARALFACAVPASSWWMLTSKRSSGSIVPPQPCTPTMEATLFTAVAEACRLLQCGCEAVLVAVRQALNFPPFRAAKHVSSGCCVSLQRCRSTVRWWCSAQCAVLQCAVLQCGVMEPMGDVVEDRWCRWVAM